MNIQPVVEGHGEVVSLPAVLRRLRDAAGIFDLDVNRPIRCARTDLVREPSLRRAVRTALKQELAGAILILIDADKDCARQLAPTMLAWAIDEAGELPCAAVLAVCEYESWLLGALESLRGKRGIRDDAEPPENPEARRGAKEQLERLMLQRKEYKPVLDQPAFSAIFDMRQAYRRCRSFRKLVKAFGDLAAGMGRRIDVWPPADWGGG